jgi:hypothetical protein
MSTRMIVEFPDGHQILFGGTGSGTGLSEVGLEEEIAKRTEAAFKSGIGAIGKLGSRLILTRSRLRATRQTALRKLLAHLSSVLRFVWRL